MVANESISLNLTEASDKDALFPPLYSINTWMNSHISKTVMTRIQLLPNLLPLNYLFYTDDLVLICTSAAGLQNQKKSPSYIQWEMALKNKPEETKTLIFQKQNRKWTREKYRFLLKGNEIHTADEYTLLYYSNDNFYTSKQRLIEKNEKLDYWLIISWTGHFQVYSQTQKLHIFT